jgi:LysR family glycine cleavage system transcriptional activator
MAKGHSSLEMNQIHPLGGSDPRIIPPLTALLAFERAATQLSFRRAARDLSLSPSAISHQIRGLEEQFGTKLFVRGARSVRLTAEGERYLAKVSAAPATLQEASRDMLRQRRETSGELWISSLPFFTSAVLLPALPELKRRHPQLTLRIEATHQYADFNGSRPAMIEAAEHGLDVALGMSPLIKARSGFGKRLVAPFAFEAAHAETIYLISRTEQARDRRIVAVRRWIADAVARAS